MAGWCLVKVAMLTDCYPPRLGGIESQVRDLSRQLVRAGHEVEVFTATAGPRGERGGHTSTGDDGVTVHRLAIRLPGGIPVGRVFTASVKVGGAVARLRGERNEFPASPPANESNQPVPTSNQA
jgi:glycosyltransferase involved in cell wall biosynthesis